MKLLFIENLKYSRVVRSFYHLNILRVFNLITESAVDIKHILLNYYLLFRGWGFCCWEWALFLRKFIFSKTYSVKSSHWRISRFLLKLCRIIYAIKQEKYRWR